MGKQRILIDGYNLIFECGWKSDSTHPSELRKSRRRLLTELTQLLTADERKVTTVVFDSRRNASAANLQSEIVNEIEVLYSVGFDDADSMLIDMIRKSSMPKQMTVVSSDHRIQRTAESRRANAIDSNDWIEKLFRRARSSPDPVDPQPEKPTAIQSDSEREMWIQQFKIDLSIEEIQNEISPPKDDEDFDDPFPPGYADDLFE